MLLRSIPSSGEMIPVIGLGTWEKFDVVNSDPRNENLLNILKDFNQNGGKLIDTSPMYGNAEERIGDLCERSGLANNFFYATKVWTTGEENGIRQMEKSISKIKRNKIDLIQIHNLVDWRTHLKTLRRWKETNKIRYIGITHYTSSFHNQLEEIIKSEKIDFVQFNYSIRVRNAEKSLLNTAKDNGVAVIINEPLEKGNLFNLVKKKSLPEWAIETDIHSWSQFFLKYILSHPAVTCIIPATSKPKNLIDNLYSGFGALPDEKTKRMMIQYIDSI